MAKYVERIDFNRVLSDIMSGGFPMIFYSVVTCWWTHNERHLCRHPDSGLPCDPRGGVLLQTDKPGEFLQAAKDNPEHYGKHGLRAFMAAHHLNCVVSETDMRSSCLRTWEEYNELINEYEQALNLSPREGDTDG